MVADDIADDIIERVKALTPEPSADVRPVSPARGPETVRRDEPVCAVFGVEPAEVCEHGKDAASCLACEGGEG